MKAKQILNKNAKKNMITSSIAKVEKEYPLLYSTIIESISEALSQTDIDRQLDQLFQDINPAK